MPSGGQPFRGLAKCFVSGSTFLEKNMRLHWVMIAVIAFPAAALAAELPEYIGKLRRTASSENVYRLHVSHAGAEVTDSLSPELKRSLQKQLNTFAAGGVSVPSSPLVNMNVEVLDGLQLAIEFRHVLSPQRAYLSCFQAWYLSLPPADVDVPNRTVLAGNLSAGTAEARQELATVYAPLFAQYVRQEYVQCAPRFEQFEIPDDNSTFLYTGVTRWLNGTLPPSYANFATLLDPSRSGFNAARGSVLVQVPRQEYIIAWLSGVKAMATPRDYFESFPLVTGVEAENAKPAFLALSALRHWAESDDVADYLDRGVLTNELATGLRHVNVILEACFQLVDGQQVYRCGAGEDVGSRLVRFTLANDAVGSFGFLVRP
ncbi:hypothetical protein [Cystobacter ferrugineus]|uniref:Uncharacterized protein n=1 Tax=Cystobacter ferrugineus TaxID=83449 RepID=A0A1L9B413_9BACT|nr:hypothetical protein [Cystobacter ferrugineus]OJH36950.1 hypothetical protein BON30_31150 [Cystobacter ferrugineus]